MRHDKDGEHMICVDCYRKQHGLSNTSGSSNAIFGKSELSNSPYVVTVKKSSKSDKPEKPTKYICTSCKYKFSKSPSKHVEKCPYCASRDIVVDDQLGADKLIKSSMNKKFETW